MQVFVVGSPLETAMALDKARLRKQIIECHQILAAIHGEGKGWIHHPVVLMYSEPNSVRWLQMYADILEGYLAGYTGLEIADRKAREITPAFHTPTFVENMKSGFILRIRNTISSGLNTAQAMRIFTGVRLSRSGLCIGRGN